MKLNCPLPGPKHIQQIKKNQRTISLITHYNIVFKNPRDVSQFRILAQQMFPAKPHWLLEAFKDATFKGNLVLDYHPRSSDEKRVLTYILVG